MIPSRVGDGPWPWALPGEADAGRWLDGLGLAPGARLALAGLNTPATAQVLAAAVRRDLVVVLLSRRLAAPELADQLARAQVAAVAAAPAHPLAAITRHHALPDAFTGAAGTGGPARGALVLFTSGSTGAAKAVRLGPNALAAAVSAHVAGLGLGPDDRWFLPMPLDHVGGAMPLLRALASGCGLALRARFDPADPLDGCTGASVVPTMLARLCETRRAWPSSLRLLLAGGGPLPEPVAAQAAALGLAPRETYGMTEMGSMATLDGLPVPGAELRIVDGRIQVRGPMLFDGYESDGRLLPRPAWHATGDLGTWTEGRLRITGRVAELIVSGGENVSAPEVEAALQTHPAVAEAAVVGLPDRTWGEVVAAAVVRRGGVEESELAAHLATRLAGFKRPRRWLFVDELPRTDAGKLRRHAVRALFAETP